MMMDGQTRTRMAEEDDGCTGLERTKRMWKWSRRAGDLKERPAGGMGKGRGRWAAGSLERKDGFVGVLLGVCQMVWGEHRW